jgi:hypothetical protein
VTGVQTCALPISEISKTYTDKSPLYKNQLKEVTKLDNKLKELNDTRRAHQVQERTFIRDQSARQRIQTKIEGMDTIAKKKKELAIENLKTKEIARATAVTNRLAEVQREISEFKTPEGKAAFKAQDMFGKEEALTRQMSLYREEGRLLKKTGADIKNYNKNIAETAKLKRTLQDINPPFQGWAMSIMFAGMALQRLAVQMKQFGTKAYDDITHSVEGSVTANDRLNASMTMLGFSVGEALAPILDSLIPIVDKIQEWVETNPTLTGELIKWGFIIGTIALIWGSVVLAMAGVTGAMLKIIELGAALKVIFMAISGWISGIGTAGIVSFGIAILGVLGLVLALATVIIWINKFSFLEFINFIN